MAAKDKNSAPISRRHFLTVSATSLLLAACGNPPSNQSKPTVQGQAGGGGAAAPTALPTPTVAVSEMGTGQRQITFWHGLGGPDGKTMTALLEQFVTEKPEFKIRQEAMPWPIFYQKFPTSVIAGTPPDLVVTHEWAIAQFSTRGILQPVDDLYSQGGLPRDDFVQPTMNVITVDGKTLGVPLNVFGWGAYVNTELLQQAGIDPAQPPDGAESFVAMAQKLTRDKAGKHPGEQGFDPNNVEVWGIHMDQGRQTFLSTIWQFGGDIISADGKRSRLNEEAVAKALQFWYDAIHTHHIAPVPVGFSPQEAFANRKLAIWMGGSWQLNFFKDTPELLPPVTQVWFTPQWGDQPATFSSAHILGIPKQTSGEQREAAATLISWLTEHSLKWADSGMVPPRASQQANPQVQENWHVSVFADMIKEIGHPEPKHPNITEIQSAYLPEFIAVLTKQKSLQEGLNDAHNRVQSILDRQG